MLNQTAKLTEDDFTTAFLKDPTATIAAMTAEHILLDTGELPEVSEELVDFENVSERTTLNNRIRGIATELAFRDDGLLTVTVKRRRGADRSYSIDLRYLDPKPALRNFNPVGTRTLAVRVAAAGFASGLLAWLTGSWIVALLAAATFTAAAALVALLVYRKSERVVFHTRHGRSPILTLYASFGCFRECRALVPKIVAAIRDCSPQPAPADDKYLRREIRDHYRLRDQGVINDADCTAATQLILSHFGEA